MSPQEGELELVGYFALGYHRDRGMHSVPLPDGSPESMARARAEHVTLNPTEDAPMKRYTRKTRGLGAFKFRPCCIPAAVKAKREAGAWWVWSALDSSWIQVRPGEMVLVSESEEVGVFTTMPAEQFEELYVEVPEEVPTPSDQGTESDGETVQSEGEL